VYRRLLTHLIGHGAGDLDASERSAGRALERRGVPHAVNARA
jgi:hypothetical protein